MALDIDTFNRLSLGIMEKNKCRPEEAMHKLESLQLNLFCGEEIRVSLPLQAALLTAVNTGKRAFLGGVRVQMPPRVRSLLNWPGDKDLNDLVLELGAILENAGLDDPCAFGLCFGSAGPSGDNSLQVVCNDWQAGVLADGDARFFESAGRIPTAGIFAGGLAVSLAFLKMSGIQIAAADHSVGISLWRPDLHWLAPDAVGPSVSFLPKRYWMLGLGHLGQAYLWNIGLLPYEDAQEVVILLQDDDRVVAANWSAGVLTEKGDVGLQKARLCSRWLEGRGFSTVITERRFDGNTRRVAEEPYVALCGFDSARSRLPLENAGFDLVVELGLGGKVATFDIMALHTFPGGSVTPGNLWGEDGDTDSGINAVIYDLLKDLTEEACGIVPLTIAGKTISASFVGACSGALVIAELFRGLHGGRRYDKISLHLRDLENRRAILHQNVVYGLEQGRNGFVPARAAASLRAL